jgi:hypothetical protein
MAVRVLEVGSVGKGNWIGLLHMGGVTIGIFHDGLTAFVLTFLANEYDETQTLKL